MNELLEPRWVALEVARQVGMRHTEFIPNASGEATLTIAGMGTTKVRWTDEIRAMSLDDINDQYLVPAIATIMRQAE